MPWHPLLLVGPLFAVLPLAAWLVLHLYRRHGFYDFPLMLLISAGTLWATCYALELILPTLDAKMTVIQFEYIGIVLVPVAWLLLGIQLHEQLHRVKPWMIAVILVIPVISVVQAFMWRTSWHYYWAGHRIIRYGPLNVITASYGPGLWLQIIYSYLLQLTGGVLILAAAFRSSRLYMGQRIMLILALVLPWTANAIYIFRLTQVPIDFTPLCIVIGGVLLVIGVHRYGLGDLIPVARERIFSQMKEGVMLFDDHLRLIDANGAALQLLGAGRKAIGRSAADVFASHRELLPLFDSRSSSVADLLYSGFDGRVVRVVAEDIGPDTKLPSRLLVFNDLSAGNRIEATLRLVVESTSADTGEVFFRSLTKSLAIALGARHAFIGALDEPGGNTVTTLAFWSDGGFLANFTYGLANSPCENLLHQRTCVFLDDAQEKHPKDDGLQRLGVTSYIGTRITGFDNTHIGVLVVMSDKPFRNADTSVSVLEVFAIRAAAELERERADARLQESEERYRRIVETTREGLCVVDGSGRIEFLNEPMAKIIGRNKSDLMGAELRDQFHILSDTDDLLSFNNDTVEVQLVRADGRKIWAAISKTVIQGADDVPNGAMMMFTDITESRLLEEQNTRIELQLQHAQKLESLGMLAGGIAHDFNNLLMPILGYLDLIQDRVKTDGLALDYLSRMRDAGGKLADLCNQMLTYSGKGQFIKRPVNLNDSLSRLADLIRASTAKSVAIDYRFAPTVPAVRADETQLDQIVINLVINASEAMSQQKSGRITIATGEEDLDAQTLKGLSNGDSVEPGRYVFVEVADEGSGIAEQDISRLFEPFFTTKFTGRGLGMAVVFGIVKGHRGAIRVRSKPGVGTTIRIYFPMDKDDAPGLEGSATLAREARKARGRVLVVDDEEMVRNTITNMLEAAGYEVITARNGKLGYQSFLDHKDNLVGCIIDVTMPELDGYSLLENIQSQQGRMPVVLVSGYHATEFELRQLDRDTVTFLQKPFDSNDLMTALSETSTGQETDPSLP